MDFNFTEEHLMIQQAARDFAQTELLEEVIERDEHSKFPTEQVKKMAELGFMGMMVDPKYGGAGLDSISYCLAMTEIAKVDASAAVIMSVNNSLVCAGMEKYCNEEQKQKYLVPLAKGEVIGAFCLSEPEAGSDATSQRTTAIDKGDHYLLNGTKNWITNGGTASTYLVIAQTDIEKGHKGINAFIVEKGWAGFEIGLKEKKMGIRGSDTHSLMFTDVKVPKENRIGEDGFGFSFAMNVLNGGAHADWSLDVQECMIVPKQKKMSERVRAGAEVFHVLAGILRKNTTCYLTTGMEIDPSILFSEIDMHIFR